MHRDNVSNASVLASIFHSICPCHLPVAFQGRARPASLPQYSLPTLAGVGMAFYLHELLLGNSSFQDKASAMSHLQEFQDKEHEDDVPQMEFSTSEELMTEANSPPPKLLKSVSQPRPSDGMTCSNVCSPKMEMGRFE